MFIYLLAEAVVGIVGGIFLAVRAKKAEEVVYGKLDKVGRITNILLLLLYICLSPLYLFIGALSNPSYGGFLGVIGWIVTFIIESAAMFCGLGLGLSVAWRKKGKSKESFIVQFAGVLGIGLSLLLFIIFYGNLLESLN